EPGGAATAHALRPAVVQDVVLRARSHETGDHGPVAGLGPGPPLGSRDDGPRRSLCAQVVALVRHPDPGAHPDDSHSRPATEDQIGLENQKTTPRRGGLIPRWNR